MSKGRFGVHGGQYIPETLMNAMLELEETYKKYKDDPEFNRELTEMLNEYAGRPSRLYYAERMTKDLGGAKIYLKREDLNHTGAHKINNVIGQMLLAKRMGKTRVIAETGAGQHGVATATVAAMMGMECEIYMGEEDTIRQALNVYRMRLLGAKVHPVKTGTATLKDAVSEAFREWTSRIDDTHYVLGSVMGPYPFPEIVRDFQAVISKEIKAQLMEKEGRLPDVVMACVGGGSNAIGAFYDFIPDESVRLIGCEAAVRYFAGKVPILGVCLGHQAICETYGATVTYAKKLMHGKMSLVDVDLNCRLFRGLQSKIQIARYHSLAAADENFPECLEVTARTEDGEIMAVKHRNYEVYGVQFHPESILTPKGKIMLRNFLEI